MTHSVEIKENSVKTVYSIECRDGQWLVIRIVTDEFRMADEKAAKSFIEIMQRPEREK